MMKEYIEEAEKALLHTYNRYQIVFDKGEGVYLYDLEGKKYLDFLFILCYDVFVRNINKYWVKEVANADTTEKLASLTANTLQMIFVANTLLHPIAPSGTENVADYIGLDKTKCFSWDNIFGSAYDMLLPERERKLTFLKEKEDFFKRHQYQLDELARKSAQ